MSNGTMGNVLDRIAAATPTSSIVVFKSGKAECLDARFGNTVYGVKAEKDPAFIGRFDGTMDQEAIKNELREHVA